MYKYLQTSMINNILVNVSAGSNRHYNETVLKVKSTKSKICFGNFKFHFHQKSNPKISRPQNIQINIEGDKIMNIVANMISIKKIIILNTAPFPKIPAKAMKYLHDKYKNMAIK